MQITREIAAKVLSTVDTGLCWGIGPADKNNRGKLGAMCVEAAVCYALDLPHGDDPGCVSGALHSLKIRLNDSNWSSNEARAKGLRRLALAQLGSKDHLDDKEFANRVAQLAITVSVPLALRAAASIMKNEKHKAVLCEAANRCEKEGTRDAALEAKKTAADATAKQAAAYAAAAAAYAAADYAATAKQAAAAYAAADYAAAAYAAAAYAAADYAAAAAAYAATDYAAATKQVAAADAAADYAAAAAAYAADAYAAAAADADETSARDKSLAAFAEAVVQILIDMKAPGCQWLDLTEAA